jgi:uncharacterized protein (UPF0332 family)
MSTNLDQAHHNLKACEYLYNATEYPDWVITTAFYSALHFVNAILFPLEESGTRYNNIDTYCQRNKKNNESIHSITTALIRKYHPSISIKYADMKNASQAARYLDYKQPSIIVAKVKRNLEAIEKYCIEQIDAKNGEG